MYAASARTLQVCLHPLHSASCVCQSLLPQYVLPDTFVRNENNNPVVLCSVNGRLQAARKLQTADHNPDYSQPDPQIAGLTTSSVLKVLLRTQRAFQFFLKDIKAETNPQRDSSAGCEKRPWPSAISSKHASYTPAHSMRSRCCCTRSTAAHGDTLASVGSRAPGVATHTVTSLVRSVRCQS